MSPVYLIVLVVVLLIGLLIYIGIRNPRSRNENDLFSRLEEFNQRGEEISLEKIELSQPFTERIIYPIAQKLGELAVRFTPQNALFNIQHKLELAGSPANLEPTIFLASQFVCFVLFSGVVMLSFTFGPTQWPMGRTILAALAFGLVGFYFPQLWIGSKISRRQTSIRRSMPDALDLLTICVEAGLGFDAAMSKVSEKWESDLAMAFARVLQEIQLGKTRKEALRDMADRIGLAEMTSFVAAVIQSEQLGISLSKVLRIQSDQMRIRRRQLAEEEAHKAPVKMLIPMALLIFPSLLIVLLAPAGMRILHSTLGNMLGL